MNAKDIIQQAGGVTVVADRFDAKVPYVRRLQYGGRLPAAWYAALCDMTSRDLPRSAFTFKGLEADT